MTLPTHLLETFVAVAESRSFTRGGEVVHRTQSAVSMQMRKLEALLDCPLFDRNSRKVELTAKGRLLLGHARAMLRLEQEALAELGSPQPEGTVRLGAPEDYAASRLPGILTGFARTCPQVRVEVICEPSHLFPARLNAGELDLALVVGGEQPPAGAAGEKAGWEQAVWAASQDFQPHEDEPLPLALYHDGCIFRRFAMEALSAKGREWRLAYVSPSLAGVLAAVRAGLAAAPVGLSYLPGDLRRLDERDGLPPLPAAAVWLCRSSVSSEAVEQLAEEVLREFRRSAAPLQE